MDQEIKEGRGCGDGSYVVLKLDHLGAGTIQKRLPSIREIAIKLANVDHIKDPMPVVPTIHYQMGGIPTHIKDRTRPRLNSSHYYAALMPHYAEQNKIQPVIRTN